MENLLIGLLFALILQLCILVHELGHFLEALRLNVLVKGVFIGVPTIIKFRWKGYPISFGLLPILGGVIPDTESYEKAPLSSQFYITLAGPVVSILFGVVLVVIPIVLGQRVFDQAARAVEAVDSCTGGGIVALLGTLKLFISKSGVYGFVYFTGIMSISIGLLNLIPFPPLDGGKLITILIEKIFGKRLKPVTIGVTVVGAILLLGYTVFTLFDIVRDLSSMPVC